MRSNWTIDLRDALRALRATPTITGIAVLSLTLGIGANTALFTILDSLLLKQLPVQEPERLVHLQDGSWTHPIWEQIQRRPSLFDGAFAWANRRFDLAERGESEFVDGAYVSGEALQTLGVRPVLGRAVTARDDERGGGPDGPVAVISHRFWQRRFGGARDVVGRALTVERATVTIVGVMPAGFFGPDVGRVSDVMIPFGAEAAIRGPESELDGRSIWWIEIWARLKPDQSVEDATAALNAVRPQIREATRPSGWSAEDEARYLREAFTFVSAATGRSPLRTRFQRPLSTLMVVVGLVLVIACANIANLLIARATGRRHELSVRLALGASRWRIGRQLLLESAILAGTGALAGLIFAHWASRALVGQLATGVFSPSLDLTLDWRVMTFTAGVAVLTAVIFGLAPALSVSRIAPHDVLTTRGRGAVTDARFGMRSALVVAQVALSLTLVVAAALFTRTFWALTSSPVGFDVDPILVVDIDVSKSRARAEDRPALFERMREAAASAPGVTNAVMSFTTPVSGSGWNTRIVPPDGAAPPARGRAPWVNSVTPGFFDLYGVRLVSGRDFDARDTDSAPPVVIVSEAFARDFMLPGSPIGQRVRQQAGPTVTEHQVVGVVEDTVYRSLRTGRQAVLYLPQHQAGSGGSEISLSVRTAAASADSAAFAQGVSAALLGVDADVALTLRPLASQLGQSITQERLVAWLSGFFGLLALLLAGLGLYGVTSHGVARRRAEIGIRMALGARPAGIVRLVLGRVGWTVGLGVVAGAALSWWASTFVSTLLHGVDARDPLTFSVAAVVLAGIAGVAAWLPARRAASIDPTIALRGE